MYRIALLSSSSNLIRFVQLRVEREAATPYFFESVNAFLQSKEALSTTTIFFDFHLGPRQIDHLLRYVTMHRKSLDRVVIAINVPRVNSILNELISAGVDDVVFSSCEMPELIVKIEIASLRYEQSKARESISVGDIVLRKSDRCVTTHQQDIVLTEKEFQLLWILASRPGENVARAELALSVWRRSEEFCTHSLEQYIHRVRKKLCLDGRHRVRIQTVYNGGYRIEELGRLDASNPQTATLSNESRSPDSCGFSEALDVSV